MSREIVETFFVYKYEELSDEAKEKAKEQYLDDSLRGEEFSDRLKWDLDELFPNSDLKYAYSLSYCQGDGLNVYGRVELCDLYNVHKKAPKYNHLQRFDEKEWKRFSHYYESVRQRICLPMNMRYGYCMADRLDFADDMISELEDMYYSNISEELIYRFEKAISELFIDYCNDWENAGYKYLYEIDDEEMEEISDANDWEYYEDGRLYA